MQKVRLMMVVWVAVLFAVLSSAKADFNITELCNRAPNSVILRPNTCTDWHKCPSTPEALDADEGSCVFGLYFNKNSGKCEYKDKVHCPFAKNNTINKNRCSAANDNSFLPDEAQCNAYLYCSGGKEKRSYCPNNLVFDAGKKACVYASQYKCPASNIKNQNNAICNSLMDDFHIANEQDCTKYNYCHKGVLEKRSCNSSYAWSYLQRKCMPVDDALCYPTAKKPEPELKVCVGREGPIPDENSCNGYYYCNKMANDTHDRNPQHYTCRPGHFFDSSTQSCRDRLNVRCNQDRCEGMGNKYVNVAGDCRAYALCANNKMRTKGICPNTHYFDERTQGCTPQVVKYAACLPLN